ncbi:16S rRNA (guanine(1207)-N(2))-methyltransferase RsmC [Aliiglaciecola sp. M165]|uniref:16S rRNA (guanine(1207)-N(2))-methyltransferase RsmC n=1 Tax=Aliiglaciecola sp. M165 TaxID=2593649 RepID=UPI00117EAE70|nr:16S rRNA (guanine(1207)-N(2))-methyltransferase RsmC [Aliiglaciecola sp. M165]TRY33882.1 16S rRNA (guanine(1207)-N(2))-methyltransferase RsmC [Aliiglaciecola sp. M165]
MLSAPSQVILRNQDFFEQGNWLVANAPEAEIFTNLDRQRFSGFHQMFDVYQRCTNQAPEQRHEFAASITVKDAYDGAIIYMPKSKEHAQMLIQNMASCIKPDGLIYLVGENKSGIKSADKLFKQVATQVNKVDSARHCALYCAQINKAVAFDLANWVTYRDITVAETTVSVAFLPGVFSAGELDPGTRLLLENLPQTLKGDILDFACGAGIIGCFLAKKHENLQVTFCDVSALAIHATELTLEKNGFKGKVVPSNGLTNISQRFNHVFTNPPFHTGIHTNYDVTQDFIAGIKNHLEPNATLTLVANRFLPYPDQLKKSLGNVKTLAQTSKFNLYFSRA